MSIQTCSPDQSLLDFLLWGCVKDQVYSTTLSIPLGNLKLLAVCREVIERVRQKKKKVTLMCTQPQRKVILLYPFVTTRYLEFSS